MFNKQRHITHGIKSHVECFNITRMVPLAQTFTVGICFLLGNSPASEFYTPTFRMTLSVPSSYTDRYLPTYEDGTDRVF